MVGWLLVEAATDPAPPVASGTSSLKGGRVSPPPIDVGNYFFKQILSISLQAIKDKPVCLTKVLYIGISV